MNYLCIFHKACADGFGAAAVVKHSMVQLNQECEFMAAHYGDEAPDVTGKNVIIVDFSYPRETLIKMAFEAKSIVVLDHHKTAEENLKGLAFCHFDMERSGAMLAWNFFFPDKEPPLLIKYIQDRDLWKWKLENSPAFSAALQLIPFYFDEWLPLLEDSKAQTLFEKGEIILQYQQRLIDIACNPEKVTMVDVLGHTVPMVNCTVLISEICGTLAGGHPFAVSYFDTHDKRVYSLRSSEGGLDVSEIAKEFGGGGHRNAAGFTMGIGHRFTVVENWYEEEEC